MIILLYIIRETKKLGLEIKKLLLPVNNDRFDDTVCFVYGVITTLHGSGGAQYHNWTHDMKTKRVNHRTKCMCDLVTCRVNVDFAFSFRILFFGAAFSTRYIDDACFTNRNGVFNI